MKTTSKKISVKASAAKPLEKPLPRDKTLVIDPEIFLYDIEDGGETEDGEESEILVIQDWSFAASKQNLAKRNFSYINMLNCEGPAVVNTVFDLTSGVFRHLYINYPMDVDQRVAYIQRIPRGAVIKK